MKKSWYQQKLERKPKISYAKFIADSLEKAKVKFPHTVEIPVGLRGLFDSYCREYYGKPYAWASAFGHHINENSTWWYYNGVGYFLNESDSNVLTIIRLKHLKS